MDAERLYSRWVFLLMILDFEVSVTASEGEFRTLVHGKFHFVPSDPFLNAIPINFCFLVKFLFEFTFKLPAKMIGSENFRTSGRSL